MKRWPGRNAPRWKHPSAACSGGAAPAPPLSAPHLRGRPLASRQPGSPQRHIPGDSRSVTRPTQLAAARESRGGKGAAEGGAAACRWSPRPDTKHPARPAPPVPTRPAAGLGAPPGCDPTSSPQPSFLALAFPVARGVDGANPAAQRRARESRSRRRGPGGSGELRSATHPGAQELPGSLRSAVGGRPRAPAPGSSRAAARAQEGASQGRGPRASARRQLSRALPLRLRSSPSVPLRLPGGGRPVGDQWGPRGRAGGTAHPPQSCRAGLSLRVVSGARGSSLLRAPRSLARSTAHTPAHTHSPHTHAARRPSAAARNVGAPPVTRLYAAPFGWVPEKCDSLVLQK